MNRILSFEVPTTVTFGKKFSIGVQYEADGERELLLGAEFGASVDPASHEIAAGVHTVELEVTLKDEVSATAARTVTIVASLGSSVDRRGTEASP